jgi:hypothetical protein
LVYSWKLFLKENPTNSDRLKSSRMTSISRMYKNEASAYYRSAPPSLTIPSLTAWPDMDFVHWLGTTLNEKGYQLDVIERQLAHEDREKALWPMTVLASCPSVKNNARFCRSVR